MDENSRCDQYRDLLETWAAWWNGPGRQGYRDPIIPPITATGDALRCTICAGEELSGERCMACGRRG
jgi:hypothetical protein